MSTYIENASHEMKGLVGEFKEFIELRDGANLKKIDGLRARISDLEAHRNRQGLGGGWQDESREQLNKGLRLFLRTGDHTELHAKAMSVGSDPQGGYTCPDELSTYINRIVFNSSPIRGIARVADISTDALEELTDNNDLGSGWVSETEGRPETTSPEIGKIRVPIHELYAAPRATQKLIDDSRLDIGAWLGQKIADRFAREEGSAFVNGNGVSRPRGFLTYPVSTDPDSTRSWGIVQYVASGASGAFASSNPGDKLIDLVASLKVGYLANSVWVMSSGTLAAVRKLKDGQGNFLWAQSFIASEPSLLLGRRVILDENMPAIAANSLSIAFGDFGRAYVICDRKEMGMLRDPYTVRPFVIFYVTKRVGGDLANSECIKLMKFAAS